MSDVKRKASVALLVAAAVLGGIVFVTSAANLAGRTCGIRLDGDGPCPLLAWPRCFYANERALYAPLRRVEMDVPDGREQVDADRERSDCARAVWCEENAVV